MGPGNGELAAHASPDVHFAERCLVVGFPYRVLGTSVPILVVIRGCDRNRGLGKGLGRWSGLEQRGFRRGRTRTAHLVRHRVGYRILDQALRHAGGKHHRGRDRGGKVRHSEQRPNGSAGNVRAGATSVACAASELSGRVLLESHQ